MRVMAVNPFSYRELEVWQLSMNLVDDIYAAAREMPKQEFDLRRQIKRAAISIPANIAEGYRRKHRTVAYQNHVSIAMGSNAELETEIIIAQRNRIIDSNTCDALLALTGRVAAMLYRLHESLERPG